MLSFSFFLLMAVAGVLILDTWMKKEKMWRRFTGIILVGAAVWGFVVAYGEFGFHFIVKHRVMLEPWNAFHYYLNAKYFNELGYFDAYPCAYQADQQGKRMFDDPSILVRDLLTYKEYTKQQLAPCPANHFSPERWQTFSQDLAWLQSQTVTLPASYQDDLKLYWNNMLFDKGYNLPPPFVVMSQLVVKLFPVRNGMIPFFIFWIDTIVAFLTFALIARWKGGRAGALFFLSYLFFFGAYRELFGLFLQNVWFFCVVMSLLFWEKKWIKMSAVALAFAGIMRIFPFFFALGPIVLFVHALIQKRTIERSSLLTWICTLGMATTALLLLGNFTGHGFAVWGEFYHKMRVHSAYIQSEWFDIGWKNFLTIFTWINEWTLPRFLIPVSTLLALVVFARLSVRRSFTESFVLGMIPIYFLVDLSPFYYFFLGLPLLFVFDETTFPWKKIGAGVFVLLALHHLLGWVGPEYTFDLLLRQPVAEFFLIAFLLFVAILVWRTPPRSQNMDAVADVIAGASS